MMGMSLKKLSNFKLVILMLFLSWDPHIRCLCTTNHDKLDKMLTVIVVMNELLWPLEIIFPIFNKFKGSSPKQLATNPGMVLGVFRDFLL